MTCRDDAAWHGLQKPRRWAGFSFSFWKRCRRTDQLHHRGSHWNEWEMLLFPCVRFSVKGAWGNFCRWTCQGGFFTGYKRKAHFGSLKLFFMLIKHSVYFRLKLHKWSSTLLEINQYHTHSALPTTTDRCLRWHPSFCRTASSNTKTCTSWG